MERAILYRCEDGRAAMRNRWAVVVYRGHSDEIAACLTKAGVSHVRELRIASPGGDAAKTLQTAQDLDGKVDLLVVDGICASSGPNYIVPAAARLRVLSNSYVLVHGSIDARQVEREIAGRRETIQREHPEVPAAEVNRALDKSFAEVAAQEKQQDRFERERLSCREWLHPTTYIDAHPALRALAQGGVSWLIVTPAMARR